MTSRLPSPSGARLSGDDYQHAITWLECLLLLLDRDAVRIRFEIGESEGGIVDDLVIERNGAPALYRQIKFRVDDSRPLTFEWFMTRSRPNGKTPLQRFYASFRDLTGTNDAVPDLELQTAHQTAPDDPLLRHRSNRDGRLVPRALEAGDSRTKEALAAWGNHLGVSDEELVEFLEHFVISPARGSLQELFDRCGDRMCAAGLKADRTAVLAGIGIVRKLIGDGVTELDRQKLRDLIDEHGLPTERPVATLLIQEIDHRAHAQLATASVDWVEEFYGDSPDERRRAKDVACWNDRFLPELRAAVKAILDGGHRTVRLDGAFRLPTAFTVGRQLNERTGVEVLVPARNGQEWSTAASPSETVSLESETVDIGDWAGLAVALSISSDISADVKSHLSEVASGTAGRLLVIEPQNGSGRHFVAGPAHARAMADAIVDQLRCAASGEEIHLFLSCPRPLAVALGHVWNRLPAGWIYADLNPGYERSYRI